MYPTFLRYAEDLYKKLKKDYSLKAIGRLRMCFTSNVLTVDALLRNVRKVNLWCHVQAVLYKNVVVGKVYISKELILFEED